MTPLNTTQNETCTPVSSKCVIWQGPDIPCINLCKGDSIDAVVSKLATVLCESSVGAFDVSRVDFGCLTSAYASEPETLLEVVQAIIDKSCTIEEAIIAAGIETNPTYGVIRLPSCLHYTNPEGDFIDELMPQEHSKHLANVICTLISNIQNIQTSSTSLTTRVKILEDNKNSSSGSIPTVKLTGTGNIGADSPIHLALMAFEADYVSTRNTLGNTTSMVQNIAKQCTSIGSSKPFNGGLLMSNISGWSENPENLSEGFGNLWIALCDMRAEVTRLKGTITPTCDNFILNFNTLMNSSRTSVDVDFYGLTLVPEGWASGIGASAIAHLIISDGANSYDHSFDFGSQIENQNLMNIDLASQGISATKTLSFTLNATVLKDAIECSKTVTKYSNYNIDNCIKNPITLLDAVQTQSGITVTHSGVAAGGEPVIDYRFVIKDPSNVVARTMNAFTNNLFISVKNMVTGTYKVEATAIYACGNSETVTETVAVVACIASYIIPEQIYTTPVYNGYTEGGGTGLVINDIPYVEGAQLTYNSRCDGSFRVQIGVSVNVAERMGLLYINNILALIVSTRGETHLDTIYYVPNGESQTFTFKYLQYPSVVPEIGSTLI